MCGMIGGAAVKVIKRKRLDSYVTNAKKKSVKQITIIVLVTVLLMCAPWIVLLCALKVHFYFTFPDEQSKLVIKRYKESEIFKPDSYMIHTFNERLDDLTGVDGIYDEKAYYEELAKEKGEEFVIDERSKFDMFYFYNLKKTNVVFKYNQRFPPRVALDVYIDDLPRPDLNISYTTSSNVFENEFKFENQIFKLAK